MARGLQSNAAMRMRRLETRPDLLQYQRAAADRIGVTFPLEYLARSRVCAAFEGERIVGGYVLVTKPPFRVIESLPDEVRARDPLLSALPPESLFEVTGLFLAPGVRGRARFWARLCWDVARFGNDHAVYAYCARKRHLRKVYGVLHARVVFSGATRVLEGMPGEEIEIVETASRWKIGLLPLRAPTWLLAKLVRRRSGPGL